MRVRIDPRHPVPTLAALALMLVCAGGADAALQTSVFGGRVPCVEREGVQFCEGSFGARVESWDGVPLDANVTLPPATMDGPFPLIVELHGWSLGKTPGPFVARALDGYAVLSYTARGFHGSCGSVASRGPDPTLADPYACAKRGWTHLADARYEGRDTQHLAGLLADEGLVIPDRIGVTGASYGGGRAMILAALKDRVMVVGGSLVPWTSPGGRAMAIAAAAPLIPWSDLAYALAPNGTTLDYRALNPYGERGGVHKQSWVDTLYLVGLSSGFYAPVGADPSADLRTWNARLAAGEPLDGDPFVRDMLAEVTAHHSAYYVDDSTPPAPLFIYNAWTDDLFPADEALRFQLKARSRHPSAEIALHFADAFGHPRASLAGDVTRVAARIDQFFARHLKGVGEPLPAFEVYTQGCNGEPERGPFTAEDWQALHPGEVRFVDAEPRLFDGRGGDAETAARLDPLSGGPCRTVAAVDDPRAATYRLTPAVGDGYTLLGSPTVIAHYAVSGGSFAQVAGRLWDVAPDGSQTLVTHAFLRPRTDNTGPQVFQLHPNGWHFAAGHVAKLELLGGSAPYGRLSRGEFTVTVTDLELRLPVLESPGGGVVGSPATPVLPPAEADAPACPPAPMAACTAPRGAGRSKLLVTNGPRQRAHRLVWAWKGDGATPGVPGPRGYTLCLYDGTTALVTSTAAPGNGTCGGGACWAATRRGARYRDARLARTGIARVVLQGGRAARLRLEGSGPRLGTPPLPVETLPLTVQLIGAHGECLGATFASAQRNDARRFRAASD